MTTKTKLPNWLTAAIDEYSLVSLADNHLIFEVFFDESNTFDSPNFRKLCERLVDDGKIKQEFCVALEANGYFEPGADFGNNTISFEGVGDGQPTSLESEPETEFQDFEGGPIRSKTSTPSATYYSTGIMAVGETYEDTGIPSLEEVTSYVGSGFNHTQEFEDPTHVKIAVALLTNVGFSLSYDARVEGGTIKRPRGGKFVLDIEVTEKRAVKRRGKVAPVFAFVQAVTDAYDEEADEIIGDLVSGATTAVEPMVTISPLA